MGLIGAIFGNPAATSSIGKAAADVAEVFVPNATKRMQGSYDAYTSAVTQFGEEFRLARTGTFDRFVDGLNRLPRPLLAFGTFGLFAYAMADPAGFSVRMQGLNYVPEPLWWLLAAIVGFYFGAREAYYFRSRVPPVPAGPVALAAGARPDDAPPPPFPGAGAGEGNAALDDWRNSAAGRQP